MPLENGLKNGAMTDVACGIHALDKQRNDDCVHCVSIRLAAKDVEIERLLEKLDKYREAAEIFRDFGEYHHLHRVYDLGEVAKARAIMEEPRR